MANAKLGLSLAGLALAKMAASQSTSGFGEDGRVGGVYTQVQNGTVGVVSTGTYTEVTTKTAVGAETTGVSTTSKEACELHRMLSELSAEKTTTVEQLMPIPIVPSLLETPSAQGAEPTATANIVLPLPIAPSPLEGTGAQGPNATTTAEIVHLTIVQETIEATGIQGPETTGADPNNVFSVDPIEATGIQDPEPTGDDSNIVFSVDPITPTGPQQPPTPGTSPVYSTLTPGAPKYWNGTLTSKGGCHTGMGTGVGTGSLITVTLEAAEPTAAVDEGADTVTENVVTAPTRGVEEGPVPVEAKGSVVEASLAFLAVVAAGFVFCL